MDQLFQEEAGPFLISFPAFHTSFPKSQSSLSRFLRRQHGNVELLAAPQKHGYFKCNGRELETGPFCLAGASSCHDETISLESMMKPRMFIGSSVEGKDIAEHIQVGLEYDIETTIWHQGVFGCPSAGTLEALIKAAKDFKFAALVLTPDDLVTAPKRGTEKNSPRDNVVFELGLFMGALGKERTFIVYNRDNKLDLPSDLAGVTPVTFGNRSDNNLQAALGPVCTKIKQAMEAGHSAEAAAQAAPAVKTELETLDSISWQLILRALIFKAYGVKVGHPVATPEVKTELEIALAPISCPLILRAILFLFSFVMASLILPGVFVWLLINTFRFCLPLW